MSEQVSALRQRMIDDMTIRNMSVNTQRAYVSSVKNFSHHFCKSPDKLTFEHVREYQLHLVSRGLQAATIIPIMCAIRFFYGTTLKQPNVAEHIALARKADTLPAILTRDQVVRFLKAVPNLEMRTIFITIYSVGLRVSEAVALTARAVLQVSPGSQLFWFWRALASEQRPSYPHIVVNQFMFLLSLSSDLVLGPV